MVRLAATSLSAVLYAWAFPPDAHRELAWVALVPLLLAVRGASVGRAFALGGLWSVASAYVLNDWFPRAVSSYFHGSPGVSALLFLGVSTLTAGLEYGAFAVWHRGTVHISTAVRPLVVAAGWVAADLGRVTFLGGDPWALLGYSQVGLLPLAQIAEVGGVHAISFVVVAANVALAEMCRFRATWSGAVTAATLTGIVLCFGFYRLHTIDLTAGPPIPVSIVQGNLDVGSQWREEFYGLNLRQYLDLTAKVVRQSGSLVVWPESAMTFFLDGEPAYQRAIGSTLAGVEADLIAGGPRVLPGSDRYFNSAFLIDATGRVRAHYDKQLLIPCAEFFPLRIDILRRSFGRVREFTPGELSTLLPTRAGAAGVLICNEAFFPGPAAEHVRKGAQFLVNIANDSWLRDRKFSEPAFDMVTLRAIEQRRWMIRASTAGPSGIIDPLGRVVARTRWGTADTLRGTFRSREGLTTYATVGDMFAIACCIVAALVWCRAPASHDGTL